MLIPALFVISFYSAADPVPQPDNELISHSAEAEAPQSPNVTYISPQAYIENPYTEMLSGGGKQNVSKNQLKNQNVAEKWFNNGTYNIDGAASYINNHGANNFGYTANIFAQTGQVTGFSFGGFLTIANPFLSGNLNPSNIEDQAQGLPINQQITPQELFIEYQYSNLVQVDVGWIGIDYSPWLTFYQNNTLNLITYQGAMVNVHPGGGWLITAVAVNAMQRLGEVGFSQQTLYNYNSTYNAGGIQELGNNGSSGTIALGADWYPLSNYDYNLKLWAYQFNNYANLAYADTELKLGINKDTDFTIGLQGGMEGGNGEGPGNVFNNAGMGNINSNFVGIQLGFNYNIFSVQAGYNNIWGANNSYGGGNIVSPDSYGFATDPLYTTGWILGMVERSAGSAYKISPSLNLLDNNLQIGASYEDFSTTAQLPSGEYDLQVIYHIPQIRGLSILGGYGYLSQSMEQGGNTYQGQIMLSYLY